MFDKNIYLLRKKVFTLFGAEFQITDEEGNLVLYAKQKAFKLKEDIRLYSDRDCTDQVLSIKARNVIDFSGLYDVFDTKEGDRLVGTLKRKGLNSILRDEWVVLNEKEEEIAQVKEDSMLLALVRRFLVNLIPQQYDVLMGDNKVMHIQGRFNPFVFKTDLVFESEVFDKRVGLALAVLLAAIEGRQE